jgi:hypothetical protein
MQFFAVPPTDPPPIGSIELAACIKTNDLLSGPLSGVIGLFTGAFGGLLQGLAILMAVVFAVAAVVTIRTDKAAGFLKGIAWALLIPIVLVLALVIYYAVFNGINSVATC